MSAADDVKLLTQVMEIYEQWASPDGLNCDAGGRLIVGLFEIAKRIAPDAMAQHFKAGLSEHEAFKAERARA